VGVQYVALVYMMQQTTVELSPGNSYTAVKHATASRLLTAVSTVTECNFCSFVIYCAVLV